jgi:hypothetical protein
MNATKLSRLATGVFAVLMAVAVAGVGTAYAEEVLDSGDPISTTCGAGTIEKCGDKAVTECDWTFHVGFNSVTKSFEITIGETNCKVVGTVPIYKDRQQSTLLSGSCNLLSPFLGMPAGSGCSD